MGEEKYTDTSIAINMIFIYIKNNLASDAAPNLNRNNVPSSGCCCRNKNWLHRAAFYIQDTAAEKEDECEREPAEKKNRLT